MYVKRDVDLKCYKISNNILIETTLNFKQNDRIELMNVGNTSDLILFSFNTGTYGVQKILENSGDFKKDLLSDVEIIKVDDINTFNDIINKCHEFYNPKVIFKSEPITDTMGWITISESFDINRIQARIRLVEDIIKLTFSNIAEFTILEYSTHCYSDTATKTIIYRILISFDITESEEYLITKKDSVIQSTVGKFETYYVAYLILHNGRAGYTSKYNLNKKVASALFRFSESQDDLHIIKKDGAISITDFVNSSDLKEIKEYKIYKVSEQTY